MFVQFFVQQTLGKQNIVVMNKEEDVIIFYWTHTQRLTYTLTHMSTLCQSKAHWEKIQGKTGRSGS